MQFSLKTIALAASLLSYVQGQALLGFNYGATKTDGSLMQESDFQSLFTKAQNLAGTSGWNSARLYTSIQGSTGAPISAIPAAIATNTKLLLGLWASSGPDTINSEIAAIKSAISQYGSKFTDLVVGISVGSEDLYRVSVIGLQNDPTGVGAEPNTLAGYITTTKQALAGTALSGVKVGHVDTWTSWYNTTNQAVIDASDFIGVDAYPYFQSTMANDITDGRALFDQAIANTRSTTAGKEIWVTETGWPTAGPDSNQAIANKANAKTYWDQVGCAELFNVTNTFWYTLQDEIAAQLPASSPKFGILDINGNEQFDLSCANVGKTPTSSVSSSSSATSSGSASSSTASVVDGGSPGVGNGGAGSAPAGITKTGSTGAAVPTGGSGSSPATTVVTSYTTTNSAGQVVTSTAVVGGGNGTAVTTGQPTQATNPSTTGGPATGSASGLVAPIVGVFGAVLAAMAL